jgi:hypothetical protein
MNDFLAFRKMLTPAIIQIVFWIGVGLCVIAGLISIFQGGMATAGGFVALLLGPVMVRIYCEVVIVFFRIHEALVDIKNNTARPS